MGTIMYQRLGQSNKLLKKFNVFQTEKENMKAVQNSMEWTERKIFTKKFHCFFAMGGHNKL